MMFLLAHADFRENGGAEAYADAIARWLGSRCHQVDRLDVEGLCSAGRKVRDPLLLTVGRLPGLRRLGLLKHALVCRALPRLSSGYDAVILTYGEGPTLSCRKFTVRHAPALFSADPAHLSALGAHGVVQLTMRSLYTAFARRIANPALSDAQGPTLANSRWTANEAQRTAPELSTRVVYPPCETPQIPALPREPHRILALGRLVPNKGLETAIAIVEAIRARGFPVHLDIVGRSGGPHAIRLCRRYRNHPFIRVYPDAPPEKVAELLARARFGLHCYRHEHFGIAVAEMILSGVVPLVYDGGGVVELVTRRELRFKATQEAVERLTELISAPVSTTDAIARSLQSGPAVKAGQDFDAHLGRALERFMAAA